MFVCTFVCMFGVFGVLGDLGFELLCANTFVIAFSLWLSGTTISKGGNVS